MNLFQEALNHEYEMALEWINTAIDKRPDAFWMQFHKAGIIFGLGE